MHGAIVLGEMSVYVNATRLHENETFVRLEYRVTNTKYNFAGPNRKTSSIIPSSTADMMY